MSENKGRDNQTHTSGYSVEEILDEAKRMKKGERPVMGMNKPSHTQTWHTDVLTKDEIMATRPLRPDQFSKPHDILDETSAPGKSDAFLRASKAGPMVHVGDRKGQTINPRALTAEELLGDAAPEREKTKIERTKERLERLLGGYDEKPAKPQKEQGAVFSGKSSGKASSAATENNSEPAVKKNEKPALRTERSALKAEKTDIPRIEPKPLSELLSDSGRDTDAGKKPVRRFFGTKGGAGGANNMSAQRIQTPPGKSENKEPERPDPTPAPSVTQAKEETKNVTGDKAPTSEKKKYGEAKPRPQGKSVSGSKDQKQDVIYRAPGLRSKSFSEITEAPKKTTSEKEKTVFEELNKPMKPDSQEKRGGLFSRIFQKGKEPGTQSKQPKQPESEELPNLFSPEKSEMKKRLPEMNSENSGIGSLGLHPTTSTDGNGKDHTREILAEELRNIPVSPVHFWRFAPGTKIGEAEKSGGDAKEKTAEPVPEEKQGIDLASETKTEEIFGRPPEEATENGAEQTGKFASSLKTPEPKSQTEEKPRSAAENAKTEPAVEEISSVSEIPVPETPARENAPVFSETPESSPEKKPLEDKKRAVKEEPETFFLDAPLPEEEPKPKRKKRSRFGGKRRTKEEPEEFFLDEPLPEEEPEPVREKRSWFGGKRRAKEEPEEFFLDEALPEEEPEPAREKRAWFWGKRRAKEEPEEFFLDEPLPEEEPEPVREKRAWFGSKRRAKEEPEELLLDEPPPDDEASESSSRIFKGKLKTSAAKQAVQMDLEDAPEPTVEPETSASKKRFTSVVKKTDVSAAAQISAPELQTAEKAELPVLDIKKQPEPQSTAESQVSLVRGEDENIDEIITSAVREIDELHKQEKLELERAEEAARLEREQAEEVERIEREQAEEAARLEEEARVRAERTAAARLAAKKAKKPPRQYTKEDYEPSVQQAAQEKFSEARPEPDEAKPGGGFAQRARRLNRRDEEYHARYETPEEDIDAGVQPDLWEDADIVSDKRRTKRAASKRAAGAPASVPPEDPARVRIELKTRREKAFTHAVLTASAGALSAVLLVLSQFAGEAGNSFVMLFISAALIAFSAFVNLDIVKSGILSLRWGRPGADTPVATAAAIALLHTLTLLIPSPSGALPPTQGQKVYAACVIFALAGGALGKFFMARSAEKNFAMIANDEVKNVGKIVDNQIQANRMAEGHSFGDAEVACAGEAANVGRFISNSFGDDPFEGTFKMFAPIALGGCLLGFIITFIATWSFPAALAAFTAFAALSVPFTQGGASGYILNRCTGSLKSRGAMLTGFKAVESFSRLDAVTVDAEELFPEGSITLYGIKTMGVIPIDRIILDAAALIIEAGGPLAGVFDKVTLGRRKILPKVDSMNVIYQGGFTGMVSGHRILIGNRRLMTEHGVPVLTPEKERSIKQSNRFTLYFSTDGELDAIFILSYTANGTIRRSISRLLRCGIHMLVHSTDPNIDEEMLAAQFGGTENHFKVMDKRGSDAYLENTSPAETADALAAYKGRITNFFSLICSCFGLRKKLYLAMLIQTALQVIGFSVSLFFVLSGSAGMTAALFILIYQIFSAALVMLFSAFGK